METIIYLILAMLHDNKVKNGQDSTSMSSAAMALMMGAGLDPITFTMVGSACQEAGLLNKSGPDISITPEGEALLTRYEDVLRAAGCDPHYTTHAVDAQELFEAEQNANGSLLPPILIMPNPPANEDLPPHLRN